MKLDIDLETITSVLNSNEILLEKWEQQLGDLRTRFGKDEEALHQAMQDLAESESPHIIISSESKRIMSPTDRLLRLFNHYENIDEVKKNEIIRALRVREKVLRDCLREAIAEIEVKWGLL